MSRLKAIRLRINSIKNTQQITKAMKMVSASKLRRAQQNIAGTLPYSNSLKSMVHNLYDSLTAKTNPFFIKRPGGVARVLIITTDKGLCGALNSNVIKSLPEFTETELKPNFDSYSFTFFGKKGHEFAKRQRSGIFDESQLGEYFIDLQEDERKKKILEYTKICLDDYLAGKINALYVVYTHYVSIIKQVTKTDQILPISHEVSDEKSQQQTKQYIYEPNHSEVLDRLVPLYTEAQAMAVLFDNIASEHSARMVAMDAATKNANDILNRLLLEFNRARQAAITKELIEIISGAESIRNQ